MKKLNLKNLSLTNERATITSVPSLSISMCKTEEVNSLLPSSLLAGSIYDSVAAVIDRGVDSSTLDSATSDRYSPYVVQDLTSSIQKSLDDRQSILQRVTADFSLNAKQKGHDQNPWWIDINDKVQKVRAMDPRMSLTMTQTSDSDARSLFTVMPLNPYIWPSLSETDKLRWISLQGECLGQWAYQLGLITLDDIDIFSTASSLATAILAGDSDPDIEAAYTELIIWITGILSQVAAASSSSQQSSFPGLSGYHPSGAVLMGDVLQSIKDNLAHTQELWNEINADVSNALSRIIHPSGGTNAFSALAQLAAVPVDAAAAVLGLDTDLRSAADFAAQSEDVANDAIKLQAKIDALDTMKENLSKSITASEQTLANVVESSPYVQSSTAAVADLKKEAAAAKLNQQSELSTILDKQIAYVTELRDKLAAASPVNYINDQWPPVQSIPYVIGNATPCTGIYPTSNTSLAREKGLAQSIMIFDESATLAREINAWITVPESLMPLYVWMMVRTTIVYEVGASFRLKTTNGLGMSQMTSATIATLISKSYFPQESILANDDWETAYQQVRLIVALFSEKLNYYRETGGSRPSIVLKAKQQSLYPDKVEPALLTRYAYYMGYKREPSSVEASRLMVKQLNQLSNSFDTGNWFNFIN